MAVMCGHRVFAEAVVETLADEAGRNDPIRIAFDEQPVCDIEELADIAVPRMKDDRLCGIAVQLGASRLFPPCPPAVLEQRENFFSPLAQRRVLNDEDVQATE